MTNRRGPGRLFADLPLFWKLLVPYMALVLVVGVADTFIVLRQLASQSQAALDQQLTERSLEARSQLHDRELYAGEAAVFAANVQGMTSAVEGRDSSGAARLLGSVLALKPDLTLAVVTDSRGVGISELSRAAPGAPVQSGSGSDWSRQPVVAATLAATDGSSRTGFVEMGGSWQLAVVEPICAGQQGCRVAGVALGAVDTGELLPSGSALEGEGVALFDARGRSIGAAGSPRPPAPPDASAGAALRRAGQSGSVAEQTLYVPFSLAGAPGGTLAVALPTEPVFAGIRSAAVRIVLLLLVAMVAMAAVGALLARLLLAQVRPLVDTSRALGSGHLGARAPVLGRDEHGELAAVMNQMAAQLEASHLNLEQQVAERTAEVERLLRDRTEFFAGLSHELRTPLAVILAQGELLRAARSKNGTAAAGEVVTASATQVLDVVNRILELARADAGAVEVRPEPVQVADLLEELRPICARLAAAAGLRLEMVLPTGPVTAFADRDRVRQLLLDLVDNAVKYTPAGGRVQVTAENGSGRVEVRVSDSGVGIPAEVGERVFEPFYRVPGIDVQGGQPSSGLGLALARKVVEAQGGTIGYSARPEGGTTFWVRLPVGPHSTLANRQG